MTKFYLSVGEAEKGILPKFACEDQIANIVCPLNRTIEIDSLFYGRDPKHGAICLGDTPQGACEMIGFDKEVCIFLFTTSQIILQIEVEDIPC